MPVQQGLPILGCDFSSSPSRRKPIVCVWGQLHSAVLHLSHVEPCDTFAKFAQVLAQPRWIGGFDLPFGLPRALVASLGWPLDWAACIAHYAGLSRSDIREHFKAFCDARPVGRKFAHRATDGPAGSSPSMKWVNPPVAMMLHAGVPALLAAGVSLAGLHAADPNRIALEAYPGFAARAVIGRASYKSDDPAKRHDPARAAARAALLAEVCDATHPLLGLRLHADDPLRRAMQDDTSGDILDAALCALQAAWASTRPNYGLPVGMDALEGWIVSVPSSQL